MMVSVCMITYKHAPYVVQALESILNQQTDFPFEVIVSDDCSPDDTVAVIQNFIATHPKGELVKFYPQQNNLGVLPNFIFALTHCSGEYIAICEGDDYWTNNTKLQQQVSFMEGHKDFSICFHRARIDYEEGVEPTYPDINKNTAEITTINDLAGGNYLHSPTVLFRNVLQGDFPAWFASAYPGDWPLHVMNACHGKIKFLDVEMSAYRVHKGGVHSTKYKGYTHQKLVPTLKNIYDHAGTHATLSSGIKPRFFHALELKINMLDNTRNRFRRAFGFLKGGFHLRAKKVMLFWWLPIIAGKNTKAQWDRITG